MGTAFNDLLIGNWKRNALLGGFGKDALVGAGGNDFLDGGPNDDDADGGNGDDTCLAEVVNSCEAAGGAMTTAATPAVNVWTKRAIRGR